MNVWRETKNRMPRRNQLLASAAAALGAFSLAGCNDLIKGRSYYLGVLCNQAGQQVNIDYNSDPEAKTVDLDIHCDSGDNHQAPAATEPLGHCPVLPENTQIKPSHLWKIIQVNYLTGKGDHPVLANLIPKDNDSSYVQYRDVSAIESNPVFNYPLKQPKSCNWIGG